MTELLERARELQALDEALGSARATGRGAVVLVAGEAGIGKTSLVRAFAARCGEAAVLAGACEPLFTPRPLGPFSDLAEAAGGILAAAARTAAGPADMAGALVDEVGRRGPTVMIVEDLHWADEATLDAVRLLARRLEALPALLVLTYREQHLDIAHPVRLVLGELPAGLQRRLAPAPLSAEAVAALAPAGVDAAALAQRTGGNPFFVTELLAGGDARLPATVRDAVLARAARLGPRARAVLGAASIVPPRVELGLLEQLLPDAGAGLDEAVESGMLQLADGAVAFRHEIARVAVEDALPAHERVLLHRAALAALGAEEHADAARLAHHAEGAGDGEAVLRYAPVAGDRASALGAHREAAQHFARALRRRELLTPERRVELLERRSYECYLTDQVPEAISARRQALEAHRAAGDARGEGDALRWLSRLYWFTGDREAAEEAGRDALATLEPLPPGRELAMAQSNLAQLHMLASRDDEAIEWGERAIALAEALGESEILAHALNNVGTARYQRGEAAGRKLLERSLELSLRGGFEEHAARAYTNLSSVAVTRHDYPAANRVHEAGIAFCRERDLDAWWLYMTGWLARSQLEQGLFDTAETTADVVLARSVAALPSRITPLVVAGRLRARRGDGDPWPLLDEALDLARKTDELQRLRLVAAARAEARLLDGEPERVAAETDDALALAGELGEGVGELHAWRFRAGGDPPVATTGLEVPWALELSGDGAGAAARWATLGAPYEAALALASTSDDELLRASAEQLEGLGARRAAAHVIRLLRRRGVRDLPVGPRSNARANPAGLTSRELDVLRLVGEGLRNREIAARLFLSQKTVDHHVSAILRKLGAKTRVHAAAEAARLGISGRGSSER